MLSAPQRIRTSDLRLRRPSLYPAELVALVSRPHVLPDPTGNPSPIPAPDPRGPPPERPNRPRPPGKSPQNRPPELGRRPPGIDDLVRPSTRLFPSSRPRVPPLPYPPRTPAIVAVINVATDPPSTARNPSRAMSPRLPGASPPIPPIWIAIDEKFANPQSA